MADELNENAEFGRKRKNEEEPILVAQRFLNIYRQMHIFNQARREQFDDMLLKMPPDIRILLTTLPGGSLLIEHIEELEKKRGLISIPVNSGKKAYSKRSSKEDVKNDKQNSSGTVVIDASFANELSSSLSLALQQTERRYKEDIRALTETISHSITESQSAIGNMIREILLSSRNNNTPDVAVSNKVIPEQLTLTATPEISEDNIHNTNITVSDDNVPSQNAATAITAEIEKTGTRRHNAD